MQKLITEKIHIATHLHDIGKIGVLYIILNKADKLNQIDKTYVIRYYKL